jgi:uncharacterized protein YndB with AHSA1/START domain
MPASERNTANERASAEKDLELTITRTFDAPRDLVYELFTEPEHIMKWMGPRDFESKSFTQDARVGGKWRGMMRPIMGGKDLWQGGTFLEIDPPRHIVYTFAWDDDSGQPGPETVVTLDFEARGGTTRLTFRQKGFTSRGERDGHHGGWSESFDKLDEHLASMPKGARE